MADCMMFPKDWHDFIKDYSFIDSERVYTNGSELIQVLRVTQLIEHLLKEQEAVEPIRKKLKFSETWECGNCHEELFEGAVIRDNYCPNCGRSVKWE